MNNEKKSLLDEKEKFINENKMHAEMGVNKKLEKIENYRNVYKEENEGINDHEKYSVNMENDKKYEEEVNKENDFNNGNNEEDVNKKNDINYENNREDEKYVKDKNNIKDENNIKNEKYVNNENNVKDENNIKDEKYVKDNNIKDKSYIKDNNIKEKRYIKDNNIKDEKYVKDNNIKDNNVKDGNNIKDKSYIKDNKFKDKNNIKDNNINNELNYENNKLIKSDVNAKNEIKKNNNDGLNHPYSNNENTINSCDDQNQQIFISKKSEFYQIKSKIKDFQIKSNFDSETTNDEIFFKKSHEISFDKKVANFTNEDFLLEMFINEDEKIEEEFKKALFKTQLIFGSEKYEVKNKKNVKVMNKIGRGKNEECKENLFERGVGKERECGNLTEMEIELDKNNELVKKNEFGDLIKSKIVNYEECQNENLNKESAKLLKKLLIEPCDLHSNLQPKNKLKDSVSIFRKENILINISDEVFSIKNNNRFKKIDYENKINVDPVQNKMGFCDENVINSRIESKNEENVSENFTNEIGSDELKEVNECIKEKEDLNEVDDLIEKYNLNKEIDSFREEYFTQKTDVNEKQSEKIELSEELMKNDDVLNDDTKTEFNDKVKEYSNEDDLNETELENAKNTLSTLEEQTVFPILKKKHSKSPFKYKFLEILTNNVNVLLYDTRSNFPYIKNFTISIENIENKTDCRTTCMIKNIPNKYTQKMLIDHLNEDNFGEYNFLYLRMDFKNQCNVGYAFVNFDSCESIIKYYKKVHGMKWNHFCSNKIGELTYASIQGFDNLINKFRNSAIMNEKESFRPKIFYINGPDRGKERDINDL